MGMNGKDYGETGGKVPMGKKGKPGKRPPMAKGKKGGKGKAPC